MKLTGLFLLTMLLTGCGGNGLLRYAYISPRTSCGYVVMLHEVAPSADDTVSKCMSLESATALAKKINADMGEDWSASSDIH